MGSRPDRAVQRRFDRRIRALPGTRRTRQGAVPSRDGRERRLRLLREPPYRVPDQYLGRCSGGSGGRSELCGQRGSAVRERLRGQGLHAGSPHHDPKGPRPEGARAESSRARPRPGACAWVNGMAIAKHGVNKVIGHDLFQDYLTHEYVMSALSRDVVAPVSLDVGGSVRDALTEYRRLCGLGELMPSFPAMHDVWRILG